MSRSSTPQEMAPARTPTARSIVTGRLADMSFHTAGADTAETGRRPEADAVNEDANEFQPLDLQAALRMADRQHRTSNTHLYGFNDARNDDYDHPLRQSGYRNASLPNDDRDNRFAYQRPNYSSYFSHATQPPRMPQEHFSRGVQLPALDSIFHPRQQNNTPRQPPYSSQFQPQLPQDIRTATFQPAVMPGQHVFKVIDTEVAGPKKGSISVAAAARNALRIVDKNTAKQYFISVDGSAFDEDDEGAIEETFGNGYSSQVNTGLPDSANNASQRSGGTLDAKLQAATNRLTRRSNRVVYHKITPSEGDDAQEITSKLAASMAQALYEQIEAEPAKAPLDWSIAEQQKYNKKQADRLKQVQKQMAYAECEQDHRDLCMQAVGASIGISVNGVALAELDTKRLNAKKNPAIITKTGYVVDESLTCIQRVYGLMRLIKDDKNVAYDLVKEHKPMDDYLRNPVYALQKKYWSFMNNELKDGDREAGYKINNPVKAEGSEDVGAADVDEGDGQPAKKRKREAPGVVAKRRPSRRQRMALKEDEDEE